MPEIGGGARGAFLANKSDKAQETEDMEDDCDKKDGNPVVLYTGNKVEPETDFASNGERGLYMQRTYNHHWSATGIFGRHWLSNFDYSLVYSDAKNILWAQRPDGRRIRFLLDPASSRWYEDKAQPVAYITRAADGSLTLFNEDRGIETYNPEGFITSQRDEQGVAWTYAYSSRYLQSVTHASGRKIQFRWSNGRLTEVVDPAGNSYRYTYTADAFGPGTARLASTMLPGSPSTVIQYHYEDARFPGALTGKSFNGSRYSTFAYDASRRATSTEHAGGIERHTFSYAVKRTEPVAPPPAPVMPGRANNAGNGPEEPWCEPRPGGQVCYVPRSLPEMSIPLDGPDGGVTASATSSTTTSNAPSTRDRPVVIEVTTTNPLGRRTTTTYEDGNQVSVAGEATARCPASFKEATYDANGYPDLVHDFADNLTDYDYDAKGFLHKRVEAVGTSAARTTQWEWDAATNRLSKLTVVGDAQVSFTYDSRGNIASVTTTNLTAHGVPQQSRTLNYSYTYHPNGLKATVRTDGPLAQDDVTQTYNTQGDLVSITNALDHATIFADYNGLGQPGKVTGSNGEVQETTYDARGRVVSTRTAAGTGWATSSVTYDGAGNIASVTAPTGAVTRYEYDAGMRLIREVSPLADGTYAWTQHSYNHNSDVVKTEVRHTDYPLGSTVIGSIDGLSHDANWNWVANGWACSTGFSSAIQVDGYAADGTYLGSATANLAGEAAIGAQCQTSGSAYRFQLPITLAHRQKLGGQTVSIYGKSPQGDAYNRPLSGSGIHAISPAPVIGDIGGVTRDENWVHYLEGWACSTGVAAPIRVHVYAGGPAGSGSFVADGHAAHATGSDVAAACQSNGTAYRFRVPLDVDVRSAHANKTLHVHGISPVGGENRLLDNSGSYTIPPVVRAAENIRFWTSPDNITNGEGTTLTAQVRNTGNVIWQGDTYLAWGFIHLTNSMQLSAPVKPGEIATFSRYLSPINEGNGGRYFEYSAQMATNGVAWGPRSTTGVTVHNNQPICTGRHCEVPRVVAPTLDMDSTEGAN